MSTIKSSYNECPSCGGSLILSIFKIEEDDTTSLQCSICYTKYKLEYEERR